jgi:hypothetical protein
LGAGEKEFFGLFTLFFDLRSGKRHSDPRGKKTDSPPRTQRTQRIAQLQFVFFHRIPLCSSCSWW